MLSLCPARISLCVACLHPVPSLCPACAQPEPSLFPSYARPLPCLCPSYARPVPSISISVTTSPSSPSSPPSSPPSFSLSWPLPSLIGAYFYGVISNISGYPSLALWSRTTKNRDVSTGPLTHPLACSHRSLIRLLRLLALLARCSVLIRLLIRSLTPELVGE